MRYFESQLSGVAQFDEEYEDVPYNGAALMLRGQFGLKLHFTEFVVPFIGLKFDRIAGTSEFARIDNIY